MPDFNRGKGEYKTYSRERSPGFNTQKTDDTQLVLGKTIFPKEPCPKCDQILLKFTLPYHLRNVCGKPEKIFKQNSIPRPQRIITESEKAYLELINGYYQNIGSKKKVIGFA